MPKRLRRWNGTSWDIILDAAAYDFTALNPVGTVIMWAGAGTGATVPPGYLVCDFSAVSRTTYAALYAVIGTKYGAGDGSTTFNLPPGTGGQVPTGIALSQNSRATTVATGANSGNHTHNTTTGTQSANHTHNGTSGDPSANHYHAFTTGTESANHTHATTINPGEAGNADSSKTSGNQSANHTHTGNTGNVSAWHTHNTTTGTESANHTHNGTSGDQSANHTHTTVALAVTYLIKT